MTLAAIADKCLPATLTMPDLTEAEFLDLCAEFPDAMLEYDRDGIVHIMPPTDPETGIRNAEIVFQLRRWAKGAGGMVTGPDAGFFFDDGSRRSPDAAWFSNVAWNSARGGSRLRFPRFAPEFAVELRSGSDRMRTLREKMAEYMENGVELGWLIDPMDRTVTVYRPRREPEVLQNPTEVRGEGPVEGFVLSLDGIFDPA